MFVQLRAPATGASMLLVCLAALGAALYFGPWRPAPVADAAPPTPEPPAAPRDGVLRIGLESPFVHDAGDGVVHLGVRITPPGDGITARAPVALALVIDSSGSMDGLAMDHARFAARTVVERLGPGDRVAVIDFDDDATTPVPLTAAGSERAPIIAAIDAMRADGSTALYGGVAAGLAALAPATDATRRLILVSDGQANVGPDTPEAVVAALDPAGVTLSTIGVGTGYDEAMMLAVADHGRGGFHHLADPIQLAEILDAELKSARAVIARDAVIELRPAPGVELLGVAGIEAEPRADGGWRLAVGELYADETRSLTVKLRVPTGARLPSMPLVDVHRPVGAVALAYTPVEGEPVTRSAEAHYVLTPSLDKVRAGQEPAWMVAADRMRVSHVLVDAAALLRAGDLLEAQAILRDERARLKSRRGRTAGDAQAELDALIALLADPYVDAQLDGDAAPAAPDVDARFTAALDAVRQGRAVDDAALAGIDAERLRVLRNAAYARHGYRFKSAELRRFFGSTGWYAEDAGFDPARLTKADVANVARIKQHEGGASIAAAAPAVAPGGPGFDPLFEAIRSGEEVDDGALAGLDLGALRRLRNTAYARHGYAFRSTDLQAFFAATDWYAADPAYAPARLTAVDGQNVRRIKAREQALLARAGGEAVRDFELRSRANARRALR